MGRRIKFVVPATFRGVDAEPEALWRFDRPSDDAIRRLPARADMRHAVWISGATIEVDSASDLLVQGARYPVTVVDLSAGGARIESGTDLPEGADFEPTLVAPLAPGPELLRATVRILDTEPANRFGRLRYQSRTRFVRPSQRLVSEIARYLYVVAAARQRRRFSAAAHDTSYAAERARGLLRDGRIIQLEYSDASGAADVVSTEILSASEQSLSVRAPVAPGARDADLTMPITLAVHDRVDRVSAIGDTQRLGAVGGATPVWRLAMPERFRQRTAREFVRWPVNLPEATVIAVDAATHPPTQRKLRAVVSDLSAGGASVRSDEPWPVGPAAAHHLTFRLTRGATPIGTRIEVVAGSRRHQPEGPRHDYRCRLLGLAERDRIAQHVFRLQAEERRHQRAAP